MKTARGMCQRLSSLCVGGFTGCRFDKLPFDFAQGLSLSMGKACVTLLLLAVGARGQVLKRLVSLQDAAAGRFPSGKLLVASDGNFDGSREVGGPGGGPNLSHRAGGQSLLPFHP